jgi:hypothetical protein
MIRSMLLVISAGFLMAAAPETASRLPIPPVPPASFPADEAAPIPNADAHAPVTIASSDLRVAVELYRVQRYDTSLGFAPGSQFQNSEERKPIQTPGLSLRLPLK